MKRVGTFEGKTHFSRLVEEAERGEVIVITRNGKPVAQLGPISQPQPTAKEALAHLLAMDEPLGLPLRKLIEEGRRR